MNVKTPPVLLSVIAALFVAAPAHEVNAAEELVPLELKLPKPAFKGTPPELPAGMVVEQISNKPRPPLMIPAGCTNLVAGVVPTCSDATASQAKLVKIADGQKEAYEEQITVLRKGVQHVQFDLKKPCAIYAIAVWHAHDAFKVYRSVVVQIADDAEFTKNVRVLFNNDLDNQAGQGMGSDRQYFESVEGKLIAGKGEKAQFVRLYSRGSTQAAFNEYTEVEIWGKPAP